MKLILLIEDNTDLVTGLQSNLEIEGYRVLTAYDGATGLKAAQKNRPNLIVLDIMLPGQDGFEVLEKLRRENSDVPVLMLTARGAESDKVRGLKLGADDYMTKPFGVLEFLARVEALLRRAAVNPDDQNIVSVGSIEVNPGTRVVRKQDDDIPLTPKEFDLLWALITANGRTLSRENLMQTVWGYQAGVLSRTVDTHILELRRKLERNPAQPEFILTVRSVGYRLAR